MPSLCTPTPEAISCLMVSSFALVPHVAFLHVSAHVVHLMFLLLLLLLRLLLWCLWWFLPEILLDEEDKAKNADEVGSTGSLISTVLDEAGDEYLIAGFTKHLKDKDVQHVLARYAVYPAMNCQIPDPHTQTHTCRLSRELAAIGSMADSAFQALSAKRVRILSRLNEAIESCQGRPELLTKTMIRNSDVSPVTALSGKNIAVKTGVSFALTMLQVKLVLSSSF